MHVLCVSQDDLESRRDDCINAELHFQMAFSLLSASSSVVLNLGDSFCCLVLCSGFGYQANHKNRTM